jgi:hypothetical protein
MSENPRPLILWERRSRGVIRDATQIRGALGMEDVVGFHDGLHRWMQAPLRLLHDAVKNASSSSES